MSEKSSTSQNTLILAAIIGAIGGIFAACIGLIPTILPMVRPTTTPRVFMTNTYTPSDTPTPEIPTLTATLTELPTATETLVETPVGTDTPAGPPTETPTTVPTPAAPSANIDDYVGTWLNVDSAPVSEKVKLVITRIEVTKTSDLTANFSICRLGQQDEVYVLPNPASAAMYTFGMAARDFQIPKYGDLRWAVIVQHTGDKLVATVQEYDTNNVLLNSDTFQLEKPSLLNSITLSPCVEPALTE